VTGASAGIGAAFAEVLASHGFDLVITARREAKLQDVAAAMRGRHGVEVHVIPVDHADPSSAGRLCEELTRRGLVIDALVNNAGYGVPGLYNAVPWQVHEDFLRVMVAGVCELTYRLLPGMVERGYGRIVNVASLAGLVPAREVTRSTARRRRSSSSSRRRCRTRGARTASTSRRFAPASR